MKIIIKVDGELSIDDIKQYLDCININDELINSVRFEND